jgi:hypothetical protein
MRPTGSSARSIYRQHNARFAKPPQIEESAFVAVGDPASLAEILCVEQERIVARDNTVTYARLTLQLPQSRTRGLASRCASIRTAPSPYSMGRGRWRATTPSAKP